MIVFGFLGLVSLALGLLLGLYVAYLRFAGLLTPGRPLITLSLLLILAGIQILAFGFIAIQMVLLRKEVLRIQRDNKELKKDIQSFSSQEGRK